MGRRREQEIGESVFSTGVWGRRYAQQEVLSDRAYVATILFITLLGLATVTMTSYLAVRDNLKPGFGLFMVTLAIGIAGCFISSIKSAVAKTVGLVLIAGPFGLLLGPIVAQYQLGSVMKIAGVTLGMTVGLGSIGIIYPRSLEHWGSYLIGGLFALLVATFIVPIGVAFGVNTRRHGVHSTSSASCYSRRSSCSTSIVP